MRILQVTTRKAVGMTAVAAVCLLPSMFAFGQSGCLDIYRNPQDSYSHNTALPASVPFQLKPGPALGNVSYRVPGDPAAYGLDDYLSRSCTTGFLVLKDGAVVFERYLQGRTSVNGLLSASMSKTVLSLLIGIAIADRKIALDEEVATILPEFKGSAFADATVEDLLRMSSGVALSNSYESGADSDNRSTNPIVSPHRNVREFLRNKTEKAAPRGTVFQYNGAQTALLGAMLAHRVGKSLTDYLQEKLWVPMGAESKAYWIKNRHGEEGVQGQFVATLRDYARLGYVVMNHGYANGKQIVPEEWIAKMTELRKDKPQPLKPPFYGLHVWIPQAGGGRSFFWGTNGQNIFVDPVAHVVIVHTGNSAKAEFDGNRHLFALRDGITRRLAAENEVSPEAGSKKKEGTVR